MVKYKQWICLCVEEQPNVDFDRSAVCFAVTGGVCVCVCGGVYGNGGDIKR